MEYTIMANIYPIILNNVVKRELGKYYKNNDIKKLVKCTKIEYFNIINRTPNMGGNKNYYIANMYLGAYLIGLYKNIKEKISLDKYNELIENGFKNSRLLKFKMKRVNYLTTKYQENLFKRTKWAKDNKTKYPWAWQIRIPENKNCDGIYFEFTQCGLCKLCINENVPELTQLMCNTDYLSFSLAGFKLIRTKTLAVGNEYCDFLISKKEQ